MQHTGPFKVVGFSSKDKTCSGVLDASTLATTPATTAVASAAGGKFYPTSKNTSAAPVTTAVVGGAEKTICEDDSGCALVMADLSCDEEIFAGTGVYVHAQCPVACGKCVSIALQPDSGFEEATAEVTTPATGGASKVSEAGAVDRQPAEQHAKEHSGPSNTDLAFANDNNVRATDVNLHLQWLADMGIAMPKVVSRRCDERAALLPAAHRLCMEGDAMTISLLWTRS